MEIIKRNNDFTDALLKSAPVKSGMRILDVGCGMREVTFLAAAMLGDKGEIVGIDREETALAKAAETAQEKNLKNVSFIQYDMNDIPESLGFFDLIIGRRVLMYQADAVLSVKHLMTHLKQGGRMAFQEHDCAAIDLNRSDMPLHAKVQRWMWDTVVREGGNVHIGTALYSVFVKAGLKVQKVKSEILVQTPEQNTEIGEIVKAMLPRIVENKVASESEIGIETLNVRLEEERRKADNILLRDIMFGIIAGKP